MNNQLIYDFIDWVQVKGYGEQLSYHILDKKITVKMLKGLTINEVEISYSTIEANKNSLEKLAENTVNGLKG
jgi:hypothetical protein